MIVHVELSTMSGCKVCYDTMVSYSSLPSFCRLAEFRPLWLCCQMDCLNTVSCMLYRDCTVLCICFIVNICIIQTMEIFQEFSFDSVLMPNKPISRKVPR